VAAYFVKTTITFLFFSPVKGTTSFLSFPFRDTHISFVSVATFVLFSLYTAGIPYLFLAWNVSPAQTFDAGKKMEIIDARFHAQGKTHKTRTRDDFSPVAGSGAIGA
jgi:hypothetical protein